MKILHVIPGLTRQRGGPSTWIEAVTRHQVHSGHRVTVLATDQGARHGEEPLDLADGVLLHRLKVRGPDRIAFAPGFREKAREQLRGSDIVHVHSIFTYPVHAALREAMSAQVPVVLRPCGLLHPYSLSRSRLAKWSYLKAWGRMVRKACTAWHFTSEQEAQNSWPWDSSPGFVVPNGVEPDEFAVDRDEARQEVWRSHPELKDSPYVLFLGRLHTKKRLDVLIPAFLQGTPQPFKLVIAGPDESKLWENLAARFLGNPRAAERVLYVGTVAGAHKMRLLAGANLFALPSQHENFGIAPLEALAAGTPVLLSPHVDLANLLEGSGLSYTEPIDTKRWAARIADLLARSQPLPQDVESLRAWARESFSWSQVANRLIERYRSVMAGCTNRSCLTNYETDSNRVEKG